VSPKRLLQYRNLSRVIQVVLYDSVQHDVTGIVAMRGLFFQLVVAKFFYGLTQPVSALRKIVQGSPPGDLAGLPHGRPIALARYFDGVVFQAVPHDCVPRTNVVHDFPNRVRLWKGMLRGLLGRNSVEQSYQRRAVPCVTGESAIHLVDDPLEFAQAGLLLRDE
jgi:hypothetical protein